MANRSYEAPRGFEIAAVQLKCVHCGILIDSSEASRHKVEHGISASMAKGSGRRQCSCPPASDCPKHRAYLRPRR